MQLFTYHFKGEREQIIIIYTRNQVQAEMMANHISVSRGYNGYELLRTEVVKPNNPEYETRITP